MEEHVLLKLFNSSFAQTGKPERLGGMLTAVLYLEAESSFGDRDTGNTRQHYIKHKALVVRVTATHGPFE